MIRKRSALRAAVIAAFAWLSGCASTSPEPAFQDMSRLVEARSGHSVVWSRDTEDPEIVAAIDRLLEQELTADRAVSIALLGNPSLRAAFEDLSIAQADLVQAGLLKNPVLGAGLVGSGLFVTLEQDFLDLAMIPMRKRVAAADLEAAKLRVGDRVLALSAEVRGAFFAAQAAEQTAAMRRIVREAAEAAAELARRQHEAGTIGDLELSSELSLASQVRIDLQRAEGEVAVERERLTRLLGLWGKRTAYRIGPKLPDLPAEEASLDHLERTAIEHRLDVAAARREVESLRYALSMAKTLRWTGFVSVQVEAAKERGEHRISFGPSASLELPIFDQRQAAIAKLEALEHASLNRLHSISIDARSEVREARARVLTARALVEEYGSVLVPIRERLVQLSQQHYAAMLLGVYDLLLAKQSELSTYREHIEALRDYWIARSDLERALGTRAPFPTKAR
ncbi:MAG: TolC family protein [Polyangiaceae bacterium]